MIREESVFIFDNINQSSNSNSSSITSNSSNSRSTSISSQVSSDFLDSPTLLNRQVSSPKLILSNPNENEMIVLNNLDTNVENNLGWTTSDECFICLDENSMSESLIPLNEIVSIHRECECNGLVHPTCYSEWVVNNMTCPICTKQLRFINYDAERRRHNNDQQVNNQQLNNQQLNNQQVNNEYEVQNQIVRVNTPRVVNRRNMVAPLNELEYLRFHNHNHNHNNSLGDKLYDVALYTIGILGVSMLIWLSVTISQ